MSTAEIAHCLLPAPLPQASKVGLGFQVAEIMRTMHDQNRSQDRSVDPHTPTPATTLHAETEQDGFVRKLSDEEWLAQ